jgi:hypothetical protein
MDEPATEKQIAFLKHLGYKGKTKKLSKWEASDLIDELKDTKESGKIPGKRTGCSGCLVVLVIVGIAIWLFSDSSTVSKKPISKPVEPLMVQEVQPPLPTDDAGFEKEPPPAENPSPSPPQVKAPVSSKPKPGFRTFTDATGKFKTEARYLGLVGDQISLEKRDGKISKLPLEKLSEKDQKWVKRREGDQK